MENEGYSEETLVVPASELVKEQLFKAYGNTLIHSI